MEDNGRFRFANDEGKSETEETGAVTEQEKIRLMREALCQYDIVAVKFLLSMMIPDAGEAGDNKRLALLQEALNSLRDASQNSVKLQMKLFPKG